MSLQIQGVKGMNDLLPQRVQYWHAAEKGLREIAWQYGYEEIRTPILEKTALFQQSIGDQTDIVEKEMYSFEDSAGEMLSMRPEATAATVRACIEHGLLHNSQQKLWYMGPMFRRERPQKGRFRQFHQFGIEAFGWNGPDIDSEIIRVGERIWKTLGLSNIRLQINTLGSETSRLRYRDALKFYLNHHIESLDEDSIRRLDRNPLRILDSKNPQTIHIINDAPSIFESLTDEEQGYFASICESLDSTDITYEVNPKLVRGLDYYTSTVFEWVTDQLGAQSAVCAGGRYDGLVGKRGGRETPAIGFAMGMERLIDLLENQQISLPVKANSVYIIDPTDNVQDSVLLAEKMRNQGYHVINHYGGGKMKHQFKKADQSGARFAFIMGDQEKQTGVVQVKNLRENTPQIAVPLKQLNMWCETNLNE